MRKLYVLICLFILVVVVATGAYFLLKPKEQRFEDLEVLGIIAEGSDHWELYYVNSSLSREGITVTTASFTTDEDSWLRAHISFDDVDVSRYDAVFIPGGEGPKNIINHPDREKVFNILIQANGQGKTIAAICHGPWILAAADLVDGKDVTCFNDADMKADLTNSGANVNTTRSVIKDGNIITASGPYAINVFTEELTSALVGGHGGRAGSDV